MAFGVTTRFSAGPGVTNSITWSIDGPGYPGPTPVASGVTSYNHTFAQTGTYTLTCEVVADTNFVKPQRYGANRDSASWTIEVSALAPPAVSPPGRPPLARSTQDSLGERSGGSVTAYNSIAGS